MISRIKANTKRKKIQPVFLLLDVPLDHETGNEKQALNHISGDKTVSDQDVHKHGKCSSENSLENNVTWYKSSAPGEDETGLHHTRGDGGSDLNLSSSGCPESKGLSESDDSGKETMEPVASPGENPDTCDINMQKRELSALQECVSKITVTTPLEPESQQHTTHQSKSRVDKELPTPQQSKDPVKGRTLPPALQGCDSKITVTTPLEPECQQHTAHQSKSRVDKESPTPQQSKDPVKGRTVPPALMDIPISFDSMEAPPGAARPNVKNFGVTSAYQQAPMQAQRSSLLGTPRYPAPRIASYHHSQQPGL